MKLKIVPSVLFFLLTISAAHATGHTYFLNDNLTALQGSIEIRTFPGPPNYEDISKGDRAETGYYLHLTTPINVADTPAKNRTVNDFEYWRKNIELIQLINLPVQLSQKIEKRKLFIIKGKLFCWQTGHHHTPVLIDVKSVSTKQG